MLQDTKKLNPNLISHNDRNAICTKKGWERYCKALERMKQGKETDDDRKWFFIGEILDKRTAPGS